PFCTSAPYDLGSARTAERLSAALGELRWNFRLAGPPELLWLMRAYRGLLGYLEALDARLSWPALLEAALAGAPEPELAPAHVPSSKPSKEAKMRANALRIRVSEATRTKVDLTFRAAVAENLVDLIPEELGPKLSARGIDVAAIAQGAVNDEFAPG